MKEKEENNKGIREALEELGREDFYPFHMPGHKRRIDTHPLKKAYEMDITEIDGFDNLHHPQGLILEVMNRAKSLYGTKETFLLVNGSTAGILTAIHACVPYGEKIIISRNSHKSVYNAIALLNLKVVYLQPERLPEWDMAAGISTEAAQRVIRENPDAKAVLVTSPTYEGFTSPIREIADLAHAAGMPLIVDEAHGAHFPFSVHFPQSAISQGADLVIQSLHKTMPSLTQTALLHFQGNLVELRLVKRFLSVFQSSSPSYLLMGSIDDCIRLTRKKGEALWKEVLQQSDELYEQTRGLKHIRVRCGREAEKSHGASAEKNGCRDPLKLILAPIKGAEKERKPYTGAELYRELLESYHLQMEMMAPSFVLGILTCMDDESGFNRLKKALIEIDQRLTLSKKIPGQMRDGSICRDLPEAVESIGEALQKEKEWIFLSQAEGREAADYINLYPPGIPLIVPGEVISRDLVVTLLTYSKQDLPLQGIKGNKISVIKGNLNL